MEIHNKKKCWIAKNCGMYGIHRRRIYQKSYYTLYGWNHKSKIYFIVEKILKELIIVNKDYKLYI